MKVTGRVAGGVGPLGAVREDKAAKGASSQRSDDSGLVSLSPEARALYALAVEGAEGVRGDLVARARMLIDTGELETDASIDRALDRLMAHLP